MAAYFDYLMAILFHFTLRADREQMLNNAAQQQGTMGVPPAAGTGGTGDDSKINLMEGEQWGDNYQPQGGYGFDQQNQQQQQQGGYGGQGGFR